MYRLLCAILLLIASIVTATDLHSRPFQILRPNDAHTDLEVVPEGLSLLRSLPSPLCIVAVVGPYRSGKSFLLNQLAGPDRSGFAVGGTVQPKTQGIWMRKGATITMKDNTTATLLLMDTEGFRSSNVTGHYDSKVFAMASLLSSYLVYNSVRIIDQSEIDQVELLVRQAQLLAIKTQRFSQDNWPMSSLANMPPLMWVVEDFALDTINKETPKQWLQRLLTGTSKDADHTISLGALFPSVDCHTLFLPAVTKTLLTDLSNADESQLTEEYRADRDDLITKILGVVQPKYLGRWVGIGGLVECMLLCAGIPLIEANAFSGWLDGPGLSTLTAFLAEASNQGALVKLPSLWAQWIGVQTGNVKRDTFTNYLSSLNNALPESPLAADTLSKLQQETVEKTLSLLDSLLLGYGTVAKEARDSLSQRMREHYRLYVVPANDEKVERLVTSSKAAMLDRAKAELDVISIPIGSHPLSRVTDRVLSEAIGYYTDSLITVHDHPAYTLGLSALKHSIDSLVYTLKHKNRQAITEGLNDAQQQAVTMFTAHMSSVSQPSRPVARSQVVRLYQEARQVGLTAYSHMVCNATGMWGCDPIDPNKEVKLQAAGLDSLRRLLAKEGRAILAMHSQLIHSALLQAISPALVLLQEEGRNLTSLLDTLIMQETQRRGHRMVQECFNQLTAESLGYQEAVNSVCNDFKVNVTRVLQDMQKSGQEAMDQLMTGSLAVVMSELEMKSQAIGQATFTPRRFVVK
eukprot:Ihof_evm5s113 gene=Ihof_evmTU5s113